MQGQQQLLEQQLRGGGEGGRGALFEGAGLGQVGQAQLGEVA